MKSPKNLQQEILDELAKAFCGNKGKNKCRDWKEFNENLHDCNNKSIEKAVKVAVTHTLERATAEILKEIKQIKCAEIAAYSKPQFHTTEGILYKAGYLNACDDIKQFLRTQSGDDGK